ncbi:hypothetical protein [Actinoplanes sp. RD1]|uniref:hypothetical protein n=1 Tax=Actinoplanes sp. RD1 TaxID=3064538 RepID=UPI0027421AE0|nr:hypothetical protein [Actinoplanes sp. RD1]
MTTLTAPIRSEETYDTAMDAISASFRAMREAPAFDESAQAFLRGDVDIDTALDEMNGFFQGAMTDGIADRERIVELTKRMETMCGTPSILITLTSCTLILSCNC